MIPELTAAFGLATLGISLRPGLYYYTYVGFAIMDLRRLRDYGRIVAGSLWREVSDLRRCPDSRCRQRTVGARFDRHGGERVQRVGSAFAFTGARELSGGRPDLRRPYRSVTHSHVLLS